MNILLLGSGGREHTLAWKIAQSPLCSKLFIAPGNAGTMELGQNVDLSLNDFSSIGTFCQRETVEMLVVGPEQPLVDGIYDYFKANDDLRSVKVIGPSKAAAQLEGSKDFAKQFMNKYGIPTASYQSFGSEDIHAGLDYIDQQNLPIVLKADGLAAGKGVLICDSKDAAKTELKAMLLDSKFGAASKRVVVEDFLTGIEFSVFVLTDGQSYKLLPTAKDYKRIGEGDTGLNTGGMGAVSPVPFASKEVLARVAHRIIQPTIRGLHAEQLTYKGFIYFGLILVNEEPYVIEYNCRLGDPETQAVLPLIKSDLLDLFNAVSDGSLQDTVIEIDDRSASTIVLASGGYPEHYEKGYLISGLEDGNADQYFLAGVKKNDQGFQTHGGRVLAITCIKPSLKEALHCCKEGAAKIQFQGKYYRKDIGYEFLT